MTCAWKELLSILPQWMRSDVDRRGREALQELRLRINAPPELVLGEECVWLDRTVSMDDLQFCTNAASRYSPWAAETISQGYLTAPGGHRIGLCGEAAVHNGRVTGLRKPDSLCIRVARDFPGIGREIPVSGSLLILGAPGWGKTTLLRDLCRVISEKHTLCVSDERCELFPVGIPRGKRMDVLSGCPKNLGIEMLLRTMGPHYIAADEITAAEDCEAIVMAANCGVCFLASAHASSMEDYQTRPIYRPIVQNRIFQTLLVLKQDKSYTVERMSR